MWNKSRCCWQLQSHVWIQNFRRSNWKITMLGKSPIFFVVLRCGWSCKEMCGTTLWVGKQDDATTLQSIYSIHWWPPLQRRIEIRRRIVKSMLCERGKTSKDGPSIQTWVLVSWMVTLAGWNVISRSHHGRIDIMFVPSSPTKAHLAFSGARAHSNNTAEMTSMIEALSFLGPHGPVVRDEQSCFFLKKKILNTRLEFAWARSRLVHMCSWHSHVNDPWYALNTNFGSPCNTCTVTVEIWVMNVLTMPPHLGLSALSLATTLPPAGFIITLTHLLVLMIATTSAEVLEKLRSTRAEAASFPQDGSWCFVHRRFFVFLTCIFFMSSVLLLSAFFKKQWKALLRPFLPRRAVVKISSITCGIPFWNCSFSNRLAA